MLSLTHSFCQHTRSSPSTSAFSDLVSRLIKLVSLGGGPTCLAAVATHTNHQFPQRAT